MIAETTSTLPDSPVEGVPEGWGKCSLGEVVWIQNGYAFPSKDFLSAGVPLVRQSDLDGETVSFEKCVFLPDSYLQKKRDFILSRGDILIGMSGSIGKLAVYRDERLALQNQRIGKIIPYLDDTVDKGLLFQFLRTIESQLLVKGKGLGISNVSAEDIEAISFELPPLAEQKRIVAKVEELLTRVDAARERLDRVPKIMRRFRQAILAAACSGRLTEDWRAEHPGVEPASELLRRIQADRMRKRPSQKPTIANGNETGIPASWVWTTTGALCDCIVPNRDKPETFSGDIPWITMPDFGERMEIAGNSSGLGLTREETLQYRAKVIPAGSVVMSCIGRFGVAAVLTRDAVINQQLHAFLVPSELQRKYLVYAIRSQEEAMSQMATSTTIAYLNKTNCNSVPVPLAPLPEQQEIVRRVEALFKLAGAIEKRVAAAKSRSDKLTQSILAKAFRGELVLTEAELARLEGRSYEPASVLLERIRAEREKGRPQTKKGRTRG